MELSFGQLIDSIQEGQTAECTSGLSLYTNLQMKDNTLICADTQSEIFITDSIRKCKWKIVPSYISLDDAFTLLGQGQPVIFELNGTKTTIQPNTVIGKTMNELLLGKWIRL